MSARSADLQWRRHAALFATVMLLVAPLLLAGIAHRIWIRRRALAGLTAKLTGHAAPATQPGSVLVHGVSLGEVGLMRPLIPRLEAAGLTCTLTTTSETGRAALDRHFPDHARAWLPLDLPWAVSRFLSAVKPRAVVLLELEVWPLLLLACRQRGIPVIVVNARVSERSFRGYRRAGSLLRPVFAAIDLVLAQNGTWGARLQHLGAQHTVVTGSMKSDMVLPASPEQRDTEAARLGLPPGPGQNKHVLLIASTSGEEERHIITTWPSWGPAADWRLVICPRHPERGGQIATWCAEAKLTACQTSAAPDNPTPAAESVVIVDEIGRLPALYANATIAVVGGSLGSGRGGQNMLEPAAIGAATVVGRDTRNFPDAMAALRATGGVVETDAETLPATIAELVADPHRRSELGQAGIAAWQRGLGASQRAVDHLLTVVTTHQ